MCKALHLLFVQMRMLSRARALLHILVQIQRRLLRERLLMQQL
jgi:hypothetical protein